VSSFDDDAEGAVSVVEVEEAIVLDSRVVSGDCTGESEEACEIGLRVSEEGEVGLVVDTVEG